MPFNSGSVTFRRFTPTGEAPSAPNLDSLDKLAEHAMHENELGILEAVEYGWCGGEHLNDTEFSFDHNVFGDALHFALRIDTNKIPPAIAKAYTLAEEKAVAATNPSGFISKVQKRDVRETVRRKIEAELRTGKHRRHRVIPVLWDMGNETLYAAASGKTYDILSEIFERTFGLGLVPVSAGSLACRILKGRNERRAYDDLRPTRFVPGPEGDNQYPEYPWTAKGSEPKDFLGNEFVLWMWMALDESAHEMVPTSVGPIAVMLERTLNLDCAYGQTGKDAIKGDSPNNMQEAFEALRSGKVPRRAGLLIVHHDQQFSFTLNPELLAVAGAILPEIEDADTLRVLFEERVNLLNELSTAIDALFATFLYERVSAHWEQEVSTITRWIMRPATQMAHSGR